MFVRRRHDTGIAISVLRQNSISITHWVEVGFEVCPSDITEYYDSGPGIIPAATVPTLAGGASGELSPKCGGGHSGGRLGRIADRTQRDRGENLALGIIADRRKG